MRNMMIRDQLMNDLADIKKDMLLIKQEIQELKLKIVDNECDHDWCVDDCGVYCSVCGEG